MREARGGMACERALEADEVPDERVAAGVRGIRGGAGQHGCLAAVREIGQTLTGQVRSPSVEPSSSRDYRAVGSLGPRACWYTASREADRDGHHAQRGGAHRGGARVGGLGRRDCRRRLRAAPTTQWRSRGGRPRASRSATGRATARRRTGQRSSPRTTGSCRSTPTSGSRPAWRDEIRARLEHPEARRLSHPAGHLVPRVAGSGARTGIPICSCGSTTAASHAGTCGPCTSRWRSTARPGASGPRAPASTPTGTSPTTLRPSIATRRSQRTSGWPRAAGPTR